jgi:hypothetical protein
MPEVSVPSTSASVDQLASFRSEIDAILDRDVLTPRLNVAAAALVAIGAMPQIELHRAALLAQYGDAGMRTLDRLVPLARGVLLAEGVNVATTERDLEPMAQELADVRNGLYLAASVLVERGLVARKSLGDLTGGTSYQARITDTIGLVSWFRSLPSAVRAATKVTDLELARAGAMADAFSDAFAARGQARGGSSAAMRDRARMFTLFFRTYQRVRQMVAFVRWDEDDLERIAPSLYAGRTTRKSDDDGAAPTPITGAPLTPSPVVSPDMPGADPFRNT